MNLPIDPPDAYTIPCAVCGRVVKYSATRLFWLKDGGGTVRTCKRGLTPHAPKGGTS
jgi:hypothetical protein